MPILVGADPELFLRKEGKFISAHDVIPGNKQKPFEVPEGAVQVDGMAVEFNVLPSTTSASFINRCTSVMYNLRKMIPHEMDMVLSPIASFDKEYMSTLPRQAISLGCVPDYNAYTGKMNDAPEEDTRLRTAAGHIHLGWTSKKLPNDRDHFSQCQGVVKTMDIVMGLVSVLIDNNPGSKVRRTMYGKAGAFRPKPYGVEYRVLSNFWLQSYVYMDWAFKVAILCFQLHKNTDHRLWRLKLDGQEIQDIINNNDTEKANNLLYNKILPVVGMRALPKTFIN